MLEIESGYGRYVGASALPSSQTIYGIVVMFTLNTREVSVESAPGLFGDWRSFGRGAADERHDAGSMLRLGDQREKTKPEVFGLSLAPAAIVEGFAVFAFVFALVVSARFPVNARVLQKGLRIMTEKERSSGVQE